MIGKILKAVFLSVVVIVGLVVVFFVIETNRPMRVETSQRIAPGITYNEFMADRMAGWRELDKREKKRVTCVQAMTGLSGTLGYASVKIAYQYYFGEPGALADPKYRPAVEILETVPVAFFPDSAWRLYEMGIWEMFAEPSTWANPCELGVPVREQAGK